MRGTERRRRDVRLRMGRIASLAVIGGGLALLAVLVWIPWLRRSPSMEAAPQSRSSIDSSLRRSGAIPAPKVTFTKDIAPIIFENCSVCHRPGEAAPFPLLGYQDARSRAEQVLDVVESGYMPPWKPEPGYGRFMGERRLEDAQIALLREWVDAGAPEGDPDDLPPLPELPRGWQLGQPDLVFQLDEPYTLPAEGGDVFRNFVIPAPVSTTRYVRAVEVRPGNPRIAHHGLLKIDRTSTSRRHDASDPGPGYSGMRMLGTQDPDGQFIVWTPGTSPDVEPEEMAWRLERGTDLVLQLHMQPSGKKETIQPAVGLFFTQQPPARTATVFQLYSSNIDIPPGIKDYAIRDAFVLPVPVQVLGLFPHAHYLGKEMRAYAELPGGTRQWLLYIKDWDFNWQDDYRYVEPVFLPAGSRIVMHYTYDNSASNPRNPNNPPVRVVAGDESNDEMGSLTLRVLTGSEAERLKLDEMLARMQLEDSDGRDPEAHYAVATSLQSQGRLDDAVVHYRKALELEPKHAPTHSNLGVLLKLRGDLYGAIRHYREAISIDPEMADAYTNLGNALTQMGRAHEAISFYEKALAIQPDSAGAHYNLGYLLARLGRADQAATHYRQAIRLEPGNAPAHNHLAWILATHPEAAIRNGRDAVRLAEIACRLTQSKHHLPLTTLAAAHAEAGDFAQAIAMAQLALQRAREGENRDAVNQIQQCLRLYQAGKPYRESP